LSGSERDRGEPKVGPKTWDTAWKYAAKSGGTIWPKPAVGLGLLDNKIRTKVQCYAKEEKKQWEDLRHGLVMGSIKFVERIRRVHLPKKLRKEIPQQCRLSKVIDLEVKLKAAVQNSVHILPSYY
jgi:hypothetical protein